MPARLSKTFGFFYNPLDLHDELVGIQKVVRVSFLQGFHGSRRHQNRLDRLSGLRLLFNLSIGCIRLFKSVSIRPYGMTRLVG